MKTIGALVALGLLTAAGVAHAAPPPATLPCHDSHAVTAYLESKYQETPVAMALQSTGALFTIFATKDGSTWTAVTTTPQGTSCILSAGKNWLTVTPKPTGPEA